MVEYVMSDDASGRRSRWNLFTERQVHVRSGDESRYVVLSRSLQMGVAAGLVAIMALLVIAAYQAIHERAQLTAQQRALEELTARSAHADQTTRNLAALREQNETAKAEIERLTSALDQAQAERAAALTASTEAGAKVAELEGALATLTDERGKLAADLAELRGPSKAPSAAPSADPQVLLAEVTGLRAELARVNRETEVLRRTAAQAQQALRDLQSRNQTQVQTQPGPAAPHERPDGSDAMRPRPVASTAPPSTSEVHQLQQDLAGAQATIAAISANLEAVKGAGSGATVVTDAAADLATLKDQLDAAHRRAERLGVTLAGQQRELPAAAPSPQAPLPPPPAPR
jgi:DNA repair exonuclease SbcCD ATPase subunit